MVQEATARHFTSIEKIMLEKNYCMILNTCLLNWGVISLDVAFTQLLGLISKGYILSLEEYPNKFLPRV